MALHVKLQAFEGPLDLLLHLIDKHELDIYDIPIREITEQYMNYLLSMQQLDLEPASEFVVMAATLLAIKSAMLLPKPPIEQWDEPEEEVEDPREELVRKLIEYRRYKEIAGHLRERELERSLVFSREPLDLSGFLAEREEEPLAGVEMADLLLAFGQVLRKTVAKPPVARIRRDEISVKARMREVLHSLRTAQGPVMFSALFEVAEREEVVATFLAILELMKRRQIKCYQHQLFEDIVVQYNGEGEPVADESEAFEELY